MLPVPAVAERLGTDPDAGLTTAEAACRLATHGPNTLRAAPDTPLWRRVLRQFADPLVWLLLVAVAISTAAWVAEAP